MKNNTSTQEFEFAITKKILEYDDLYICIEEGNPGGTLYGVSIENVKLVETDKGYTGTVEDYTLTFDDGDSVVLGDVICTYDTYYERWDMTIEQEKETIEIPANPILNIKGNNSLDLKNSTVVKNVYDRSASLGCNQVLNYSSDTTFYVLESEYQDWYNMVYVLLVQNYNVEKITE